MFLVVLVIIVALALLPAAFKTLDAILTSPFVAIDQWMQRRRKGEPILGPGTKIILAVFAGLLIAGILYVFCGWFTPIWNSFLRRHPSIVIVLGIAFLCWIAYSLIMAFVDWRREEAAKKRVPHSAESLSGSVVGSHRPNFP